MNLIFLTMSPFYSLEVHNIYADLLKEFIKRGHKPYLVVPTEAGKGGKTELLELEDYAVLRVKAGNTSNVSLIEKGISTIMMERQFISAIKDKLGYVGFSLILYSTPPVTFAKVIRYLKKKYQAPAYLLLKDIFPQNAVDLGMFHKKGPIYAYFRKKEKQLYAISDQIGCMSPKNVDYLLQHNPWIMPERVHVNPNGIRPICPERNLLERLHIRNKYKIPLDATVFIYGGNIGRPQGIPFLIECLRASVDLSNCCFVICGTGTEYSLLESYVDSEKPLVVRLIHGLPKEEYDKLLLACDIGLLFLDHRFTIPNIPSRMLSYMEQAMPVLACTDPNTDIGQIIRENGFGWWCESNDARQFVKLCSKLANNADIWKQAGNQAREYLINHYTSDICCQIIYERLQLSDRSNK